MLEGGAGRAVRRGEGGWWLCGVLLRWWTVTLVEYVVGT